MVYTVPTVSELSNIYSLGVDVQTQRYARLTSAFCHIYGNKPDFVARAPGRVNIIGEHIDYCGFPVFPMAIALDTLIAVRANGIDRIHLANVNNEKYPARKFSTSGDIFKIDPTVHEWSNYFKCGYRSLLEHLGRRKGMGFDALLDGAVPAGGGLSSSAAFVCATQLAVQRVNGIDLPQTELALVATGAERYVGVNSGGMDQTASIMGCRGSALFIEFNPVLKATTVKLPKTDPALAFIIANTLVVSDKAVTAPVCYNLRVFETRIGALILAKHLGISNRPACRDVDPLTFKIVMDEYFSKKSCCDGGGGDDSKADSVEIWINRLGVMLEKVQEAFGTHSEGYTREEMVLALDMTPEELSDVVHEDQFLVHADRFKLFQRAQHAFSEAMRVVQFRQICESDNTDTDYFQVLGDLMNQSQNSCRNLFECSCTELDELCYIARQAGAFGSRLTGAGWGGCTVHLVPANKIDNVKNVLLREYYSKRFPELSATQLASTVFATVPGSGACYYV
ncbi:Galactokinase [Coemansia reversa NRRL 1564]|uniref:Galactokinase n=1 Tax=Coemansia reversa (strain ATCC 12441 / NRRL 1564) TaxID=763665 RepID=A0A2G5B6Q8_COERN|nr:Galactokinase [Coemansia reversa NRRL 1564]|eukprot:PIA14695.1 Galactokinase [Coemansia reversa NRRL 1564]